MTIKTANEIKPNDTIVTVYGDKHKVTHVMLCSDGTVVLFLEHHSPCNYYFNETIAVVSE